MNQRQHLFSLSLPQRLEAIYEKLNRFEFIHPDPLEFVHQYENPEDKEVVALIASSLAYGRVSQILKSVGAVLGLMSPEPAKFLRQTSKKELARLLSGFKHRFTKDSEMVFFLIRIRDILNDFSSLESCFLSCYSDEHISVNEALSEFAVLFRNEGSTNSLIPLPSKGSGCKRLHLFLRWMVRDDCVDPGCWKSVPPSKLIIPLDTHMFNIGKLLGLTDRKSSDMKTAVEITNGFKIISPDDPVKYDFALTRLGIRSELSVDSLVQQ